jgi:choice-of-anchor B domain-containing protein
VAYTHQGWLTEDHRYYYMNDEGDEANGSVPRTRTLIWDLADLEDPQLVGEYLGETSAIDHNLYVKGDFVYESNYMSGLRILDITNREQPIEVGFIDTLPFGENVPSFAGSWSNYPYFESGTIVVSSIGEGLFVVRKSSPATVF